MPAKKYTVEEQQHLIPDADVKAVFLQRPEIRDLPRAEQDARWEQKLQKINRFRAQLAELEGYVVGRK